MKSYKRAPMSAGCTPYSGTCS